MVTWLIHAKFYLSSWERETRNLTEFYFVGFNIPFTDQWEILTRKSEPMICSSIPKCHLDCCILFSLRQISPYFRHLGRFSRFCRAHCCDRQTDIQTDWQTTLFSR